MLSIALALVGLLSPSLERITLPYNTDEGIPPSYIYGTMIDSGQISNQDGVVISDGDWITLKSIVEGTDYCDIIANIAGDEVVKRVSEARDSCIRNRDVTTDLNSKLRERIVEYKKEISEANDQRDMYRYVATGTTALALGAITYFIVR